MIRDEFKNLDKKVIDKKANKKMQEMGERAYYAKKLSLYSELLKPIKVSTIFCIICFAIPAILYIVSGIITKEVNTAAIVIFALEGALILWGFAWFIFIAPNLRAKIAYYKDQISKMNRDYVLRNKNVK